MLFGVCKFFKRLIIDFWLDCFKWVRFYFCRSNHKSVNFKSPSLLELNGVEVLEDFISDNDVNLLIDVSNELNLKHSLFFEGQLRGRVFSQGLIDDRLSNIVDRFSVIAKKYLRSDAVKLELSYFQISIPTSDSNNVLGGQYHMDDNKPNIKFFVYLSDVNEFNGPFMVVPDTHGLRLWKLTRYLKWSLLKNRSYLYSDNDQLARLDAESVKLVGENGFCFVADTTAWHRADAVQTGKRLVFVASFNYC